MDTYTKLALDWLAGHPNPESVTTDDPTRWAARTSDAMSHRIRAVADHLAPSIPDEPFLTRLGRLSSAWQMATEVAIDEFLPTYEPNPDETEDWVPLVPDISDLL